MSAPFLEPFSSLVATFNLRRAIALITIILIFTTTALSIDYYTSYSRLSRLERTVSLIERLNKIEVSIPANQEILPIKQQALDELSSIGFSKNTATTPPQEFGNFLRNSWIKFCAGGLPWFALSLFAIPGALRKEKDMWAGFLGIQFLTLFFGFVFIVIPSTEYIIFDLFIAPWGLLLLTAGLPISIAAARKVRDSGLERSIINNLRQISAAADQFYLETGNSAASIADLVGPGKYIRHLQIFDGERYDELIIEQGKALVVFRKNGNPISWGPF